MTTLQICFATLYVLAAVQCGTFLVVDAENSHRNITGWRAALVSAAWPLLAVAFGGAALLGAIEVYVRGRR